MFKKHKDKAKEFTRVSLISYLRGSTFKISIHIYF